MIPQPHLYHSRRKQENYGRSFCLRASRRCAIAVCLALVMVCSLFFLTTVRVQANTVTINDQASVLDAGRVQAEAAKLPVPVLIYTTTTFTGGQGALNESTRAQLPDQGAIAIGIDTVHRHVSIEAGTNAQLSNSQMSDALSAFQRNYNGGDYTGATIAALDSLQNALSGGGGINPLWVTVAIILGITSVAVLLGRRRRGGSDNPPRIRSWRMWPWTAPYPYYGGIPPTGTRPSGPFGGGASGNFGGGMSGGGAGGSFGGGSTGGGAGGSF